MKNFKLKRLLGLAFIGGFSALSASTAFAAAGTSITNTATLAYEVSGVAQTDIDSNTETFTEDLKINFTVAELGGTTTTVTPGELLAYQTFTVTNDSNAPQDFLFAALNKTGDDFDATTVKVYVDSAAGVVGVPTSITYTQATDLGIFMNELAAGETRTVYIVSTIPADAADTEVANMTLVAQVAAGGSGVVDEAVAANAGTAITNDDNNHTSPIGVYSNGATTIALVDITASNIPNGIDTEDTVFADAASGTLGSDGAADDLSNGQHSDDDSYTVSSATLSVVKLASALWDPINGGTNAKAIPGAFVQYTITITNNGAASADLTTLSDTLTATVLDPDLIDNTATPENAAGDGIKVVVTGGSRAVKTIFCTGDLNDATTVDGCSYDDVASTPGNDMVVNLATVLVLDAGNGYTAGELKPTEVVTITYNVVVQ